MTATREESLAFEKLERYAARVANELRAVRPGDSVQIAVERFTTGGDGPRERKPIGGWRLYSELLSTNYHSERRQSINKNAAVHFYSKEEAQFELWLAFDGRIMTAAISRRFLQETVVQTESRHGKDFVRCWPADHDVRKLTIDKALELDRKRTWRNEFDPDGHSQTERGSASWVGNPTEVGPCERITGYLRNLQSGSLPADMAVAGDWELYVDPERKLIESKQDRLADDALHEVGHPHYLIELLPYPCQDFEEPGLRGWISRLLGR